MLIYLITHNDLSVSEGPVTHFTEVASNLQKLGHEVRAFAPDLTGIRKSWGFGVCYLSCVLRREGFSQAFYEIALLFRLWKEARGRRPAVIYSRQSYITLAAPFVARLLGIPLVTEVNGVFVDDLAKRQVWGFRRRLSRFCEDYAYKRSERIIAVSSVISDAIKRLYRVPEEKVDVLLNGVNAEHFKPQDECTRAELRAKFGVREDEFCVGYVGCFTPFDGVELLPLVGRELLLKRTSRIKFLLVGNGEKKGEVERLVSENSLGEHFSFVGRIDYDKLPKYLSAFDVGIAPYVSKKDGRDGSCIGNCSLKCLEYLAMGIPVISTHMPQLSYIQEVGCGVLTQPDDISVLASAVTSLMQKSKAELREFGRRGRDYVRSERSWFSVAQKTEPILERAAALQMRRGSDGPSCLS